MATITEDYVSFETAKLLKEKGFNERLLTFYLTDEAKKESCFQIMAFTDDKIDNNHSDCCYLAPTLQMALKWLREVHNLHIIVFHYDNSAFPYIWYIFAHNGDKPNKASSYEQACEAAIKYCLENLI